MTTAIFLGFALGWALLFTAAACTQPGTCNNTIVGPNNVANCGGTGDGETVTQTTPAPVVVPPVVVTPPPAPGG